MKDDNYVLVGVVILFFGIGWVAYASVQPLGQYSTSLGPFATCLSQTANTFYLIGGASVLLGAVLLVVGIPVINRRLTGMKSA
jgi:hypothetical protein